MPRSTRRARERHRQRRAADDHLPAARGRSLCAAGLPSIICRIVGTQCENVTPLARDQAEQHVGHVAARVDLLHAQHRRDVGQAPGVHVEHRRDRHVDVARGERRVRRVARTPAPRPACAARAGGGCSRRPWAGRSCRSCRTSSRACSRRAPGKANVGAAPREHRLVLGGEGELACGARGPSSISTNFTPGRILSWIASSSGRNSALTRITSSCGVIDRVEHLLRRDAHVHRVQHRAHHRHREEALEVAVAVPVHHRDRRARADAQRGERRGEAAHALGERRVGVARAGRRRRFPGAGACATPCARICPMDSGASCADGGAFGCARRSCVDMFR